MPAHTHGGVVTPHAPNAALLIDFDNVTMGIRSDLQTELKNLLSSDIVKGKVSVQRAYADWRRYPQYIVPLSESSIDLIFAPAYGSSKKNATDIRLAIDALELVFTRPEIGTFILLSGDSDFSSLVIKLKEYGKYVIGVGIRESSSDLLVQNCDEYYSYNALAGLVRFGEEESVRWDPWELVSEAVGRMKRNGDVMRADRLKQVMQQIDTEFDEKNLGMSKFSRFVSEAAQRGLLSLKKLENGQIEIDQSAAKAVAAPSSTDAAPTAPGAEPARVEKGRPRSRGGRGRGREKERKDADAATVTDAKTPPLETDIGERLDVAAAAHPASQADGQAPAPAESRSQPQPARSLRSRGLGPRGLRGRGAAGLPPELLAVGVVEIPQAAQPSPANENGERAAVPARKRTRSRKTSAAKKSAAAEPKAEAAAAAGTRPARSRARTPRRKRAPAAKTTE
ncbi:MAG TPA: NYN domain-containing protein [Gemmatimonadaceae bacterium]|nr:NYN domain-containing protein [Gemmatimonadaceae bacterium]